MSIDRTPENCGDRFTNTPLFTSQNQLFKLDELDAIRQRVGSVFKPHELSAATSGNCVSACMHHVNFGQFSLNRLEYGAPVIIDPGRLESFFLIQVPIHGEAQIKCGERDFISSSSKASFISPTLPLWMRWEAASPQLALRIERSEIEHHFSQHLGHMPEQPVEFFPEIDLTSPAGNYFLQLMAMLIDSVAQSDHPIHQPLVLKQFESLLINTLIYSQPHNLQRILESPRHQPISPYYVKRTEEYIRSHAHEALTIEQLAEYAGVSVRTLFAGFREFCGTSPMAYLRDLRLEKVHAELSSQQHSSITEVAYRWGFAHLGRFAQEYKRRYGVSPSATVRFRS